MRHAYQAAAQAGDYDTAVVWAGECVDLITSVEAAAMLVEEIIAAIGKNSISSAAPPSEKTARRHVDERPVGKPFDERLVARLLHEPGHAVHRPLEVTDRPLRGPGRARWSAEAPAHAQPRTRG